MRILFPLSLGFLSGIIATVLLFTVNDALRDPAPPAAGVGNAQLVMDAHSLGLMLSAALANPDAAIPAVAEVDVRSDGTIAISFGVTPSEAGPQGWIIIDPDVRDGALEVFVIEAEMDGTAAESVAAAMQDELRRRLASLAGEADYTLVAIGTTGNVLTLEIDV